MTPLTMLIPAAPLAAPRSPDLSTDPGLGPALLVAKDPGSAQPVMPQSTTTEFVAVSNRAPEQVSATGTLVTAYVVFWCLVAVFVWRTWTAQARLATRLAELESELSRREAEDAK